MVEIAQVTTVLNGLVGLPGYSNFYFFGDPVSTSTLNGYITATHNFWDACAGAMPQTIAISINADVPILNPADGALQRVMAITPPSFATHGPAGNYAGGVGACVTWSTAAVHGRKRLRGRTFIVPMAGAAYDADGTLGPSTRTSLITAAAVLQSVAGFGVWGRPRKASVGPPPVTELTGAWSAATASSVRDHVAVLRSRRD